MEKNIKFHVYVIAINADVFEGRYTDYITTFEYTQFDDKEFILEAPMEIYEEIENSKDDGIYIV